MDSEVFALQSFPLNLIFFMTSTFPSAALSKPRALSNAREVPEGLSVGYTIGIHSRILRVQTKGTARRYTIECMSRRPSPLSQLREATKHENDKVMCINTH